MTKSELKKFSFNFWTLQIIGWLFYWVMICVTFLPVMTPERSVVALFEHKFVRAAVGFALTVLMRAIYKNFAKRFSLFSTVIIYLFSSVLFGVVWTYAMNYYAFLTSDNFDFASAHARSARDALDYSITLAAWSAIYFGITYWREWQQERENALEAAALANQAQLEMLRYQLNPHFLFNSLNSIRASIDEDSARAKRMVTQLSEFLRYSLLNCDEKEVSLSEELEATRNYLAIEKIRFEEKLEVLYDVDDAAKDFRVPCFLLNPLVENAVKHGLNGGKMPLKILIQAHLKDGGLQLSVANTGSLNGNGNGNGTKVGLKNVRERLEKLFPARSNFDLSEEKGWVKAQISISNN